MRLDIESKIKYLVDVQGIRMTEIAEKCSIHVSTISNIYRCKYEITEATLEKLISGYPEEFGGIAPSEKKCSCCKTIKSLGEFYNSKKGKYGKGDRCKTCDTRVRRECRNKDEKSKAFYYIKSRERMLRAKYKLTLEQYNSMLEDQDYKCKICNTTNPAGEGVDRKDNIAFAVDHCHNTMKVRGLLCNLCNRALGFLQDDPVIVSQALNYLEQHK